MASDSELPEPELPFSHLGNNDFNIALYEMTHGPLYYDSERLSSLLYNPIDNSSVSNQFFFNELDPDQQFTFSPPPSNYYTEDEINAKLTNSSNSPCFSVFHINTRSLIGHLDKFKFLLSHLQNPFSAICVSETWLTELTSDQVEIPGYKFISNHRDSKSAGGAGLYLLDDLEYKLCRDCNYSEPEVIETLFVEINIPNGKNIIVGTVYRPPNYNIRDFLEKFNEILAKITRNDKYCYLGGDYNIDLFHYSDHAPTQEFVDSLFSHMFIPLINRPTRITAHSATLIDNIFTNNVRCKHFNGIVINDISDHLPVFVYEVDETEIASKNSQTKYLTKRDFSERNKSNFRLSLSRVNWNLRFDESDTNECYNSFVSEYVRLYNESFPLKTIKLKTKKVMRSPWITQSLLVSIRKKDKLYKQFINSRDSTTELKYKRYRNKLNHLIKIAKRKYYDTKFEKAKNNLKETWKLINDVINKPSRKAALPNSFFSDGKLLNDPQEIANCFCKFFTNIGPNLARKIPDTQVSFRSFLGVSVNESLILNPTNISELNQICNSFKSGKSPGYDNVSMDIIKSTFDLISQPLANVINLSLIKGVFPDELKIAKLIPVFKAGDSQYFTNYRPISLLSNFSKFFERVMHNRITNFLDRLDILYCCQFGFRKKYSTALSLIHLINKIATAIDKSEYTVGIFLDLSKAFDTLDHQILLSKLEHYGIHGLALSWLKSYLSNRVQFVQYKETCSIRLTLSCGVPQGSILGPLLFVLYINDLPCATRLAETMLFADDTSVFYSNPDLNCAISAVNNDLSQIDLFMKANKLSVNITKTNYIIFAARQKPVGFPINPVLYDEVLLKQVKVVKFLGVFIDEHLTWKPHITYICKKISKSIGVMFRSRFFLSETTKKSLYYTLIYPYLTYCTTVWSSTYVTNLNRIFLLQKRAVRIITNADFRAHSEPLFFRLKILDIYNINSFYTAQFMFSYYHQLLPPLFSNLFVTSSNIHNYNTRSSSHFRSHACRTNTKQFSILFQGPKIWNSLPNSVTSIFTLQSFKTKVFDFLLYR